MAQIGHARRGKAKSWSDQILIYWTETCLFFTSIHHLITYMHTLGILNDDFNLTWISNGYDQRGYGIEYRQLLSRAG
ncbi:uncharacterized protein H6S33_000915 [Morchella sextelata]|uniref:uncharacterized protein n=1 Tax=Morchella sextelata TaxID=1174677 RepID=UPI001D042436|nr:uncharacterized protein H6S33_000915 [Morchella sextelata]KAH0615279.1 hypothetical protein H6S33_000915 [Morchella sextelata]